MKKALLTLWISLLSLLIIGCQFGQTTEGFRIYFDSNGGSYVSSIEYQEEITFVMPNQPTKDGFEFDGWYFDNQSFIQPFSLDEISIVQLEDHITLYAKWIEKNEQPTTVNTIYDEAFLSSLDTILEDGNSIPGLMGVTISVNGEMLDEQFYNYLERNIRYNIYSVTKSITSLLVGIAIDLGYIHSVDDSMSEYIDLSDYNHQDDLENITIKNLLTMTDGIYWDSNDLASEMIELRRNLYPLDYVLNRQLSHLPGDHFNYSDGAAHLISYVISNATGMKTNEFAYEALFEPMGISNPYWTEDRSGYNIGGCDLYLSNYELDMIGQMVMNHGIYNGERIVSQSWIIESTTMKYDDIPYYGYYWWLSRAYDLDIISANGYGGQHIYIIPAYDLVITTLANAYVSGEDANIQYNAIDAFVIDDILRLFSTYNEDTF
jgi:uncharacterized repeat protein (TIGR02543 family)